jgi:hypothetical protein
LLIPILDYLSAPKNRMMKQRLLLFAATLLAGTATAQNYAPDYNFSVGIYGGISPTTKLYKVTDYSGDEKSLPNHVGIIGHYNIMDRLQVGIDINTNSEWSSKGTSTLRGLDGSTLGNVGIRYLYADRVWSTTFRVNGMVPMYDRMRVNRSNFYYGIAFGGIFTVNDGTKTYSQFDQKRGEEFRYASELHFEPAAGYTLGFQVGMEWYMRTHFGLNVEFAPRFSHLNTVDTRAGSRNGPYDLFTFPISLGIRYRFGSSGNYRF